MYEKQKKIQSTLVGQKKKSLQIWEFPCDLGLSLTFINLYLLILMVSILNALNFLKSST